MAAAIFSTVKSKKVGKTIIIRQLITKKKSENHRLPPTNGPKLQSKNASLIRVEIIRYSN
jgi:hypothetical protein